MPDPHMTAARAAHTEARRLRREAAQLAAHIGRLEETVGQVLDFPDLRWYRITVGEGTTLRVWHRNCTKPGEEGVIKESGGAGMPVRAVLDWVIRHEQECHHVRRRAGGS